MTDTTDQQAVTVALQTAFYLLDTLAGEGLSQTCPDGRTIEADETVQALCSASYMEPTDDWHSDLAARLASVSSASAEIPAGMKPWTGGNGAPDDWDGGSVLRADGQTEHSDDILIQQWKQPVPRCKWNIVAYTPARVLELPEPVPATNQAGEVAELECEYDEDGSYALIWKNGYAITAFPNGKVIITKTPCEPGWMPMGCDVSHLMPAETAAGIADAFARGQAQMLDEEGPDEACRGGKEVAEFIANAIRRRAGLAQQVTSRSQDNFDAAMRYTGGERETVATQPATSQEGEVGVGPALSAAERVDTLLAGMFPDWEADQRQHIALECAIAALAATPTPPTLSEDLRAALDWALPLAERAVDDHRMERLRCGHSDIVGTYKNGVTWAGIHQSEVDQIERARAALAQVKAS